VVQVAARFLVSQQLPLLGSSFTRSFGNAHKYELSPVMQENLQQLAGVDLGEERHIQLSFVGVQWMESGAPGVCGKTGME